MRGQQIVSPLAENLAATAQAAAKKGRLPPVHLWDPPFCGNIDMRIARDGTWFHEGTPIGRPALVRLFAGILRRDGADYFLVTPAEKVGITVEDAPFVAVDFVTRGRGPRRQIIFTTNLGDTVAAGPKTPLRVSGTPACATPVPYVRVRANLDARIDRKTFYRLAEIGTHAPFDGESWFGLWSGGAFFPMIASDALSEPGAEAAGPA